jgi:hypothetical protein
MMGGVLSQCESFVDCPRYRLGERPARRTIRVCPVQTILPSRRADEPLRILVHPGTIMDSRRVFQLRLDEPAAHLDGIQFAGPDAPEKNLIAAISLAGS